MANQHKSGILFSFFLAIVGVLIIPMISSCGKGSSIAPSGQNTQLEIINLSPDGGPLNLYLGNTKISVVTYTYPNNSGYFFLSNLSTPVQLRTATTTPVIVYTTDSAFTVNLRYTLFVTGYKKDKSALNSLLVNDPTGAEVLPAFGRGKVRFVHTSPSSPNLDVRANDTVAFSNRAFNTISKFIELPAGNYNFTVTAHKTPAKIETTLENVTIQDGRLYTIYTQGIVGRTDSVAFGAAVLTNNPLIINTQ